jgi:hypothetical protein
MLNHGEDGRLWRVSQLSLHRQWHHSLATTLDPGPPARSYLAAGQPPNHVSFVLFVDVRDLLAKKVRKLEAIIAPALSLCKSKAV